MKGGKISQQDSLFLSDYRKNYLARVRRDLLTLTHDTTWHYFGKLQEDEAACFNFPIFNICECKSTINCLHEAELFLRIQLSFN